MGCIIVSTDHCYGAPQLSMSNPTFAESFCAKYNVPRERYARAVFKRTLYRRTYLVGWLLPILQPNYFAADFDLIYGVENLRRTREFLIEAKRFNDHPENRGFLRRTLCLRVSTSRLKALIRETLPRGQETRSGLPENDGTAVPFDAGESGEMSRRVSSKGESTGRA